MSTMAASLTVTRKRRRLAEDPLALYNGLVAAQKSIDEKNLLSSQNSKESALESTVFPTLSSRPLDTAESDHYMSPEANIPSSERSENLPSSYIPVSIHSNYPTTFFLIVVVHLLFLYQWNARRSRKQVLASYRMLVQKKQFHRIWLALLSHPPKHGGRSRSSPQHQYSPTNTQSSIAMGDADANVHNSNNSSNNNSSSNNSNTSSSDIQLFCSNVMERIQYKVGPLLEPLLRGHASGLPLLLYNSHILWSCRALERNYQDDSWHYGRLLIVLAVLAVAIELFMSNRLLQSPVMSRAPPRFQSIQPDPTADAIQRIRKKLLHRTVGTLTVVSTAILLIFRSEFRHVPLQILPFFPNPFFLNDPSWTCTICIVVLLWLSRGSHSGFGVLSGSVVGMIWSTGLLSFLAEEHWGSGLLVWLMLLSLLSLKADPQWAAWVPCIDHIAWDRNGRLVPVDGQQQQHQGWTGTLSREGYVTMVVSDDTDEDDDDDEPGSEEDSGGGDDDDDDADEDDDVEASRQAFPRQDDNEIYGHLPDLGDMLEEDDDDDVAGIGVDHTIPLNRPLPNSVRSRRGGGTGSTQLRGGG
jgi:hypothetical protein